jgi:vacuolar protein sorting-associated protein 72
MLGCFVGPADGAARGVPERFSGKPGPARVPVPEPLPVPGPGPGTVNPPALEGEKKGEGPAESIPNKPVAANGDLPSTPTAQAPASEPMDVDK